MITYQAPKHPDFWSFKAASPTPAAPPHMTPAQWESLSPGMRREIGRQQPELWGR